jgi:hypothetical protein
MKIQFLTVAMVLLLGRGAASAQVVSEDSVKVLQQEKKQLEDNKELNDQKLELAKLQNEYQEKMKDAKDASEKARASALENQQAASRLSANAQDKKLANAAKSAARKAERDAKNARKAADNQEKLYANITTLQEKITEQESKISGQVATLSNAGSTTPAPAAPAGGTQASPVAPPAQPAPAQAAGRPQPPVQQINNPVRLDGGTVNSESVRTITEQVVESTYRNYPQNAGQPNIIINNIIIPSDYEKRPAAPQPAPARQAPAMNQDERSDYEEYLAWKKQKNARMYQDTFEPGSEAVRSDQRNGGFRERFGEKQPRKSGMWVIPMVGVHASDFKADFSNNEADGRTGWNAGLDFRMHTRRFFVQPGVHYFNSSLRFTESDSLSSAPLLDGPRIHSLKVPLLLGLYLTKANSGFFKFNIKGGATGNYVIAVDNNNQSGFDKDNIEEFSYGLAGGIGIEFGILTIDLSHEWGMSRFIKDSNSKNNVLRATVGFKL